MFVICAISLSVLPEWERSIMVLRSASDSWRRDMSVGSYERRHGWSDSSMVASCRRWMGAERRALACIQYVV